MDIHKTCRTCSKTEFQLFGIHESSTRRDGLPLAEMLKRLTDIESKPNDGMPQNICVRCLADLNYMYEFKEKCLNMDYSLRVIFLPTVGVDGDDDNVQNVSMGTETVAINGGLTINSVYSCQEPSSPKLEQTADLKQEYETLPKALKSITPTGKQAPAPKENIWECPNSLLCRSEEQTVELSSFSSSTARQAGMLHLKPVAKLSSAPTEQPARPIGTRVRGKRSSKKKGPKVKCPLCETDSTFNKEGFRRHTEKMHDGIWPWSPEQQDDIFGTQAAQNKRARRTADDTSTA